jgi:hypothetical protein
VIKIIADKKIKPPSKVAKSKTMGSLALVPVNLFLNCSKPIVNKNKIVNIPIN